MLIAVVIVATLAAITVNLVNLDARPQAAGPPPEKLPFPCPPTMGGQPVAPTRYTDKAPAFGGPAPHRLKLFSAGDVKQAQGYNEAAGHRDITKAGGDGSLPVGWEESGEADPQLVVCEYVTSIGDPVQTCEYAGAGQSTLLSAVYGYRVIEARTSRAVTEFTLASGALCPSEIRVRDGSAVPPRMLEGIVAEELENALRPTVEP